MQCDTEMNSNDSEEEIEKNEEGSFAPDVMLEEDSYKDLDVEIIDICENVINDCRKVAAIIVCVIYTGRFDKNKIRIAPTPRDSIQEISEEAVDEYQCPIFLKRFHSDPRLE